MFRTVQNGILQATKISMLETKVVEFLSEIFKKYDLAGEIEVNVASEKRFGDFFTNYLLKNRVDKQITEKIVEELRNSKIFGKVELVGAGFLNLWISDEILTETFADITIDSKFGKKDLGSGKSAVIEIVSANPTGPIHLGNARGGPIGDVLASLFEFFGYKVTREFYLNNIGGQVKKFKDSIQSIHSGTEASEYSGEFYETLAKNVKGDSEKAFEEVITSIKKDLEDLGVKYDNWVTESSIKEEKTEQIIHYLMEKGLTKEKDGALWFAPSNEFLEDRECVLLRSDEGNTPTYFANDIAYHKDKYDRGYEAIVNIWGANHHGHVPRMKAAMKALGSEYDPEKLEVVLYQWVSLIENGKKKSMSKRKGDFVTLREVLDAVGKDPIRFAFLSRDYNTPQDIDLETLVKKDKENQLYYIQYALARVNSILVKAEDSVVNNKSLSKLELEREKEMIMKILTYPEVLLGAYKERKVHRICFYLLELSDLWHKYYEETSILSEEDAEVRNARLYLAKSIGETIKLGLGILGIAAPDRM